MVFAPSRRRSSKRIRSDLTDAGCPWRAPASRHSAARIHAVAISGPLLSAHLEHLPSHLPSRAASARTRATRARAAPAGASKRALARAGTALASLLRLPIATAPVRGAAAEADALADFVRRVGGGGRGGVERLLAQTLGDPLLAIAWRAEGSGELFGLGGEPLDALARQPGRSCVDIELDGQRSAVVVFDSELEGQRSLVEAAGKAAVLTVDRVRLDAELAHSTEELQRSRRRLLHAALSERERIQRDLHDSAQQRILCARVKARRARELAHEHPERAAELIADVDEDLQGTLAELRCLVNGVFPPVLSDHGLRGALRAACERASVPALLDGADVSRHGSDVESAVYFTCVEAIQNAEKHAGPGARITVRAWEQPGRLCFSVSDSGAGFVAEAGRQRGGLLNMRDRVEALGGSLAIDSRAGAGTVVSGSVPLPGAGRAAPVRLAPDAA